MDDTIDLSEYRDRFGSNVPAGVYRVVIEEIERDTSNAGNKMYVLYMRVQGGDYDGATLIDRLAQTPKALFKTVAVMQALGLKTPAKKLKVNFDKWIGKPMDVEVAEGEPYNGKVRTQPSNYFRVTKSAAKVEAEPVSDLDDDDEAEDGAEEVAEETTSNPSPAAKKRRRPEPVVDPDDEDDIDEDEEPELQPRKRAARKAAPADEVDAPEEIDLDDVEL